MELFVPGRLLIVGDHSDWVGMFNRGIDTHCIITLLDKGIYANVEKSDKFIFKFGEQEVECELKDLLKLAKSNSFFKYAAGTAQQLAEHGGVKIEITKMDLPIAKGLASSATVCVLVAKAYNELYNLHLSKKAIMYYAYFGEITAKSKCGRGDQVSAYDEKVTHIIFNNGNVSVSPIKLKGKFCFLIADLKSKKNTSVICKDLQKGFLESWGVRDFLEIFNTEICNKAHKALTNGNVRKLARCMNKSFKLFDEILAPYSKEELKAPKLHEVTSDCFIKSNTLAAKGIGAQGDGSIQILCKNERKLNKVKKYLKDVYDLDAEVFILKP